MKLLIAILLLHFSIWAGVTTQNYEFHSSSQLEIHGTSTAHDWDAVVGDFRGSFELDSNKGIEGIQNLQFEADVLSIISGRDGMDDRLYKGMKADDYPTIGYKLTYIEEFGRGLDGWTILNSKGYLTIAGEERFVIFNVEAKERTDGAIEIKGEVPLFMTDYGIKPPSALMGVIKAGNEVSIKFYIVATQQ